VWEVWTDVEGWPRFLDMKWAELDGDFAVGGGGRLKPGSGPASKFRIVALEPGRFYETESSMPGAKLRFEHLVEPTASGATKLTERKTIEGPLSGLYGLLFGRQMKSELPESLDKLGELALERDRRPDQS
jgi:Polyketide cyclase / dehydrase and lipid transport